MKQYKLLKIVFLWAVIAGFPACDPWHDDTRPDYQDRDKNLYELIGNNPDISIFAQALQATGYDRILQEEQALTVFAPQNAVLQSLDLQDTVALKQWIQNHIAWSLYFTGKDGNFLSGSQAVNHIQMLNNKSVNVGANTVSGSRLTETNLVCGNGVLHIIDNMITCRKNIWDYLVSEQENHEQVKFIQSYTENVMDRDRSVQTGVDIDGNSVYDTVWVERNTFLEQYPLGDEQSFFTVVLLENDALEALKTKYAKYFVQKDAEAQNREVFRQVTADLILQPVVVEAAGRYLSKSDILVDIDPAEILETYQASNGIVYRLSNARIKIYQNKIKEQILEAEDGELFDGSNAWITRYRSYASGGKDIVLKGTTRQTFYTTEYFPDNDSTATYSSTQTFTFGDTYLTSTSLNSYAKFTPTLYSTDYEIYWVAYDDDENDYNGMLWDSVPRIMTLEQKLLIGFPGEPEPARATDGKISNNFSPYFVLAGVSTAGVLEETQLSHYRVNNDAESNVGFFLLGEKFEGTGGFGGGNILKSPAYGQATFMVANTPRSTASNNNGLLFLDYIRIVPKVDVND
ncbi:MAG: fasciclin domain-containing protein [Bacteroidales bacterium]|jgi:hypothetical protein|nr:fasciclin domain-containing protein [Bacteroidales bacterium]